MPDAEPFSQVLAEILRNADRTIRYLGPKEHRRLYNVWRVTMGAIAPVDSFYVAFFRGDRLLVVPYVYDEAEEFAPPGFQMYGADGLAAWIKLNVRPYLHSVDNGRLLSMGHSIGDDGRKSQDAIVIPLLSSSADEQTVVGLASMQTYRSAAYDGDVVRAFEWLARCVVMALDREREDAQNLALLDGSGNDRDQPVSVAEIVEEFGHTLELVRRRLDLLIGDAARPWKDVRSDLIELRSICEMAQSETAELLLKPSRQAEAFLQELTPREREVAQLVGAGLSNDQIAARLIISERTVRTHVTRVLKAFGVRQRAAVVAKLRPFE